MAHRREEKEALRREREERERRARSQQQRKRLVGYGGGGLVVIAAILVAVFLVGSGGDGGGGSEAAGNLFPEGGSVPEQQVFDYQEAVEASGCELSSTEGRGERDRLHTRSTDVDVDYRDNPPTLGRHWPPGFEAEDGLYARAPADESLVHTLEHGRVIIWVKPSMPESARSTLRALFDEDSYQLVMVPRRDMDAPLVATAWNGQPTPGGTGRTMTCDRWTPDVVDALRAFRDEHRSNGPEPVP